MGRQSEGAAAAQAREAHRAVYQRGDAGGVDGYPSAAEVRAEDRGLIADGGSAGGRLRGTDAGGAANADAAHVSDPDDDVVIGTALAAKADLLVTGDHALLDVWTYQGIRIASVAEALGVIATAG